MIATEEHCILTVCLPDAGPTELPLWRAASGAEALSILRLSRVDLLLTGLALPDMSPWQLIRRMRASAHAPRWALIATELSPADEIQARSLGAVAVLEDPPDHDALLALFARSRRAISTVSRSPLHATRGSGRREDLPSLTAAHGGTATDRRRLAAAAPPARIGTDSTR